jgi:hypothetical protein
MVRTRLVRGDAELLDKQVTDGEALGLATGDVDVSRHSVSVEINKKHFVKKMKILQNN